jgi:hypothetical protein
VKIMRKIKLYSSNFSASLGSIGYRSKAIQMTFAKIIRFIKAWK